MVAPFRDSFAGGGGGHLAPELTGNTGAEEGVRNGKGATQNLHGSKGKVDLLFDREWFEFVHRLNSSLVGPDCLHSSQNWPRQRRAWLQACRRDLDAGILMMPRSGMFAGVFQVVACLLVIHLLRHPDGSFFNVLVLPLLQAAQGAEFGGNLIEPGH